MANAIKQWKMQRALRLYREGKVTLWRAARLAGVTLREMMELEARERIQFQYAKKRLRRRHCSSFKGVKQKSIFHQLPIK